MNTTSKLTVAEMKQRILNTFQDVAEVVEVPGNPNMLGYWLFRITDSQNRSGRVWVTPEGEIVTPQGK
jgi:hypothetical protein